LRDSNENQSETAGPFRVRLFEFILSFGLVVHAAHAARWHWIRFAWLAPSLKASASQDGATREF
jgi:hypothetical protein